MFSAIALKPAEREESIPHWIIVFHTVALDYHYCADIKLIFCINEKGSKVNFAKL